MPDIIIIVTMHLYNNAVWLPPKTFNEVLFKN